MPKTWLNIIFTIVIATVISALAADITEAATEITPEQTDIVRLAVAFVVGSIVQALTLVASGRGYTRLERATTKAKRYRARATNISEALLAGLAAAAAIAAARGWARLELPLSGEFALAAVAGSLGAEKMFKILERRAVFLNDDEKAGDGQ